jgi:hypothetical protein
MVRQQWRVLLHHYGQRVGGPYRAIDKLFPKDQDLRPVIHLARDQSARIQGNAIDVYVENHSPKEQQLESLPPSDEEPQSE